MVILLFILVCVIYYVIGLIVSTLFWLRLMTIDDILDYAAIGTIASVWPVLVLWLIVVFLIKPLVNFIVKISEEK